MGAQRRRPDHFARRARQEGHAARSVYKLEEMDRKWRLIRPGARILDLGCAPGSWLEYAASRVGAKGRVIGYDLQPVGRRLPAWAEARVGNVFELQRDMFEGLRFDVILSDMAPATMGDHKTDAYRSSMLAQRALELSEALLAARGSLLVKVLEGPEIAALVKQMRGLFARVERYRPGATRKASTEIYLFGAGRRRSGAVDCRQEERGEGSQ